MAKKVGNPWHDPETGEFTSAPGGTMRWSRLSKQGRAKLQVGSRMETLFSQGKAYGSRPRKIAEPFQPSKEQVHAVGVKTAKAVDRDFQRAKDKAFFKETKDIVAEFLDKKGKK